jgi:sporulation related protein
MIKVLKHLNSRDKKALAVFWALALLCFLYFASGILVTYVSSPNDSLELAAEGRGFSVSVLGFPTHDSAERLSVALQNQRHVPVVIERNPTNPGYMLRVGPLAKRGDAENLTNDLRSSGYDKVSIAESCPPGTPGCNPQRPNPYVKD